MRALILLTNWSNFGNYAVMYIKLKSVYDDVSLNYLGRWGASLVSKHALPVWLFNTNRWFIFLFTKQTIICLQNSLYALIILIKILYLNSKPANYQQFNCIFPQYQLIRLHRLKTCLIRLARRIQNNLIQLRSDLCL